MCVGAGHIHRNITQHKDVLVIWMYLKTLSKQTIAIGIYGKSPKNNNKQLKTTAWFHLLTLWLFLSCEFPGYVKEILVYDRDGDFLCALYVDGSQTFCGGRG